MGAGRQVIQLGGVQVVAPLLAGEGGIGGEQPGGAAQQLLVVLQAPLQAGEDRREHRLEIVARHLALERMHATPGAGSRQSAGRGDQQGQQDWRN